METQNIIYMLIALALGTQLCRFLPLFLPKTVLSSPILQKLNKMLPLVIMVLLVLTSLSLPKSNGGYTLFIAQIIALVGVVASYAWLRNVLFSVGIGILGFNLFLYIL